MRFNAARKIVVSPKGEFQSIVKAAEYFGYHRDTVVSYCEREDKPEWYIVESLEPLLPPTDEHFEPVPGETVAESIARYLLLPKAARVRGYMNLRVYSDIINIQQSEDH